LVDQIFNDLPSFWQGEFVEAVKDLLELWGHDLSLQEWQAAAIIAQGLLGFGDAPDTGYFLGATGGIDIANGLWLKTSSLKTEHFAILQSRRSIHAQIPMTTLLRQRLQILIEALPEESLLQAESLLTELNSVQAIIPASQEEPLLEIIQRRLPLQQQARLNYLRQCLADEIITEEEHQELLAFIDPIEQMDAERVEAMIKLAQLRKVSLNTIIQEFLPNPQKSHGI
jgi:hypothetical protein